MPLSHWKGQLRRAAVLIAVLMALGGFASAALGSAPVGIAMVAAALLWFAAARKAGWFRPDE
jgi:Na+/H+ antiporter NhaD/arsenite permease-like protein